MSGPDRVMNRGAVEQVARRRRVPAAQDALRRIVPGRNELDRRGRLAARGVADFTAIRRRTSGAESS